MELTWLGLERKVFWPESRGTKLWNPCEGATQKRGIWAPFLEALKVGGFQAGSLRHKGAPNLWKQPGLKLYRGQGGSPTRPMKRPARKST